MSRNKYLLVASVVLSATIYSCKKETQDLVGSQDEQAAKIIKTNSSGSLNRVDLSNQGVTLNFEGTATVAGAKATEAVATNFPYQLVYRGKVNPQVGVNNNLLSALEVSAYGNYYAIGYQTPGKAYGGGVDVIQLQPSGAPQVVGAVSTKDADVTCVTSGGGRLYVGMDLETFENFKYPAPAVVGVIKINSNNLQDAQVVGLEGYSTTALKYNENNGKLYTTSATNGGVSIISFNGDKASRTAFQPYGSARSLTFSNNDLIATNGYSYAKFDVNTAAETDYKHWNIKSDDAGIGAVASTTNGNLLFGNNFGLIYVNKADNSVLNQIEIGGWINSISIVDGKIYVSNGNSLIVAEIVNNKIKVLAQTHFASKFGGEFKVISSKVVGSKVFVACAERGTYVFDLEKI
ncbi:hypothetical protein [Pedobacter ureilyticus]|uniref:DUF5074 domain-containing protein n=1 Tax=Pedobacter ureilyticus TaxID=1393051 RepID=A0ABW9JAH0_9SPHI|nr:hypothetical protein [Pedobacter helvus]